MRLHGRHRGRMLDPPEPPSAAESGASQSTARPADWHPARQLTPSADVPARQPAPPADVPGRQPAPLADVPGRQLAPPADVPGRFSFSSEAPAYLRQAGRSSSMADLRQMPLSLPPRRRGSAGDHSPQPPVLGRTLRHRQSSPEAGKSSSRVKRTLPKRQSPKEARRQTSSPRERQGRSLLKDDDNSSSNRRNSSNSGRDSSRNRRNSSKDKRDSSKNKRGALMRGQDSLKDERDRSNNKHNSSKDRLRQRDSQEKGGWSGDRPGVRYPAAGTPPRRSADGQAERLGRARVTPHSRQQSDKNDRGRVRGNTERRLNVIPMRRARSSTVSDDAGAKLSARDREQTEREDGRTGGRNKADMRDDRNVQSKNTPRGRVSTNGGTAESLSQPTGERAKGVMPMVTRERRSRSQNSSEQVGPQAARREGTRRSRSASRNTPLRRR